MSSLPLVSEFDQQPEVGRREASVDTDAVAAKKSAGAVPQALTRSVAPQGAGRAPPAASSRQGWLLRLRPNFQRRRRRRRRRRAPRLPRPQRSARLRWRPTMTKPRLLGGGCQARPAGLAEAPGRRRARASWTAGRASRRRRHRQCRPERQRRRRRQCRARRCSRAGRAARGRFGCGLAQRQEGSALCVFVGAYAFVCVILID